MTTLEEKTTCFNISRRLRRNRKSSALRSMIQETHLHPSDFVSPMFIIEGENKEESIESLPGVKRLSIDLALKEVEELAKLGIPAIDLFPVIPKEKKDPLGREAYREENLLHHAIRSIKQEIPEICVMVDVALDPYTDHGHDGIVNCDGEILNDETLAALGKMTLHAAHAGADVIAPSDMMDGRVGYLRHILDQNEFTNINILAYTAKYASALYGPFRDALGSSLQFGDKKTYQMDPANVREALLEAQLDEAEGADMLMVKPALAYLDVIARLREQTELPIGAYHVSGEYAMIHAAAERGWIDGDRVMRETLLSIKRAGADFIFTYAAKQAASSLCYHE